MALLFWRGRTAKKAFRDRFCAAFRERVPDAVLEPTEDLGVRVRTSDGDTLDVWLGRAYDEFCKTPAEADELVARWVRLVESSASKAIDPDNIVPIVKPARSWLAEQRAALGTESFDPWIEPYNSELGIVYAESRDGLHFSARADFEALGIPLADLRVRALANLRRIVGKRTVSGADGFFLVGAGGTLDASLLLLDDFADDPRIVLRGEPLLAIPDRDTFAIADSADPLVTFDTAASAARLYRSEPYPISPHLFRKSGGIYEPLDAARIEDTHPIPNLDVIDVHATKKGGGSDLALVVASPLRADARSMFRLLTKLDGYLEYVNSPGYRTEHGEPTPRSTRIVLALHAECDPGARRVLDSLRDWVEKRNASFVLEERWRPKAV